MKVHLTFDVEVWCNDWSRLDERFPKAFQRYVFGRSAHGDYALPKTLEILAKHDLHAVFFVEPLFAARFGVEHLAQIVALIQNAGQEIQLHLHPEWVDELPHPPIEDHHHKRQHLCYYTATEQKSLIRYGAQLLQEAGCPPPTAFRAGSFACNLDTFAALRANGLNVDSSLDACSAISGADMRTLGLHERPAWIDGVYSVPVTTYMDGLGRPRSAQINGSSYRELVDAIETGAAAAAEHFVLVSHNFEMLKPGLSDPDPIVVRRFEALCGYLSAHRASLPTSSLIATKSEGVPPPKTPANARPYRARLSSTATRYAEQAWRRF